MMLGGRSAGRIPASNVPLRSNAESLAARAHGPRHRFENETAMSDHRRAASGCHALPPLLAVREQTLWHHAVDALANVDHLTDAAVRRDRCQRVRLVLGEPLAADEEIDGLGERV